MFRCHIVGCAGRDNMTDKLDTIQGRDDYVTNVLHSKMIHSRADFKALMKERFHGDVLRFSQLMKSYWHVTGESRKQASGRPHKAEDDNATLRCLINKYGVPATIASKKTPMLLAL